MKLVVDKNSNFTRKGGVTLDPITERRQAGRTPRAGWAFIEQKRRDEARRLKRELAETRARMADYFFAMSVPYGGA